MSFISDILLFFCFMFIALLFHFLSTCFLPSYYKANAWKECFTYKCGFTHEHTLTRVRCAMQRSWQIDWSSRCECAFNSYTRFIVSCFKTSLKSRIHQSDRQKSNEWKHFRLFLTQASSQRSWNDIIYDLQDFYRSDNWIFVHMKNGTLLSP